MIKWSKILFITGCVFGIHTVTEADMNHSTSNCGEPCDEICDCEDGLTIQADWLYWKTRRSGLDYAIPDVTVVDGPEGGIKCIDPKWEHGFRLGLFKDCGGNTFGARYTVYRHSFNNTCVDISSPETIVSTRNHPGNVSAFNAPHSALAYASTAYRIEYSVIDVDAGHRMCVCGDRGTVMPYAGLQFTFIDQMMNTIYSDNSDPANSSALTDSIREQLDMRGYGSHVGVEGAYDLCGCLGICAKFETGLALSEFESYWFSEGLVGTEETFVDIKKKFWLIVPNWDTSIALCYDLSECFCNDWSFHFGYEIRTYCCLPDFFHWVDQTAIGNLTRNSSNIGFDGLFIRVNGIF